MSEEEIKDISGEDLKEETGTVEDTDAEESVETEISTDEENIEAADEGADDEETDDTETDDAETDDEYQSQFSELTDEDNSLEQYDETVEDDKSKKGSAKPIIITLAIVVVLAVIGVVLYFIAFAPTINGTWKATDNENMYFTISDDKFIVEGGDEYTYSYSEYDCDKVQGKDVIYLTMGGTAVKYTYKADGNMFTGRTATLTTESAYSGTVDTALESVSEKNITQLKLIDNFKENKNLTGTWSNSENGYTFTFDKNGIVKQVATQSGYTEYKCAYSTSDNKVTIRTSKDETSEMDLKIDGDTLTLTSNGSDMTFTRVK